MGTVKRDGDAEKPRSVKWYVWWTLGGLLLGVVETLINPRDVDVSLVSIAFAVLFTYGIIAVLLRGVWRGSRLAWILSALLQLASVFFMVTNYMVRADTVELALGVVNTVIPMFWLFHRETRAWCRVVF